MKFKYLVLTMALAAGMTAGLQAQSATATAGNTAADVSDTTAVSGTAAPARQFTDTQIFEMLGWYVIHQASINELDPSPALQDSFIAGERQAFAGKPAPYNADKIEDEMARVLTARQTTYQAAQKVASDKAASEFFAKVKQDPDVKVLPDGLMYKIVQRGDGVFPSSTDTVQINYVGTLIDGTKFDSSYDRGEPAEFPVDNVIPGMTEGLQKIDKGGKIRLYIPANLAYGDKSSPTIPAYSPLVFDVEMVAIVPTVPDAAAAAAADTDATSGEATATFSTTTAASSTTATSGTAATSGTSGN